MSDASNTLDQGHFSTVICFRQGNVVITVNSSELTQSRPYSEKRAPFKETKRREGIWIWLHWFRRNHDSRRSSTDIFCYLCNKITLEKLLYSCLLFNCYCIAVLGPRETSGYTEWATQLKKKKCCYVTIILPLKMEPPTH